MIELNLPSYNFRRKIEDGKNLIFDEVRRKFVVLTPEEWVRQHIIKFLIGEKGFPKSLIGVEYPLEVFGEKRRCDILLFGTGIVPLMVVECKAPEVKIDQGVFDQIAQYNSKLNVEFLLVTNGLQHYCCTFNRESGKYSFIKNIPSYSDINR